jgi:mono/diheme cytochrome c family protein
VVGLIVVLVGSLYFVGGSRLNATFDIEPAAVVVPTDVASIERGRHLVTTLGLCQECHGENLEGDVMSDDPVFGRLVASNLTSGKGGVGGRYTDADFVRAIRHGVGEDGRGLVIMPAQYFNKIGDSDLGAIIAYLKNLPLVDNELPSTSLGPLGRIISLIESEITPVRMIDHDAPRPPEVVPEVTAKYGEYRAITCTVCHGDNLTGGTTPSEERAEAPNITASGVLRVYTEAHFLTALRTGVARSGRELDNELMPWKRLGQMTDDELKAIYLYLQSLTGT